MEFVSWEYDSQYMESHSKFHGSSHHQADDKDSPISHPPKKNSSFDQIFVGPKKDPHHLDPQKSENGHIFFGDFRSVYHNFWILTISTRSFLLGSRDLLLPILCAISLVLHPPCWPISRDRSLGNTRRAVAVFGGLGTPNKRNLLLRRLRWDLLSLSNRLICVHYIIYIYIYMCVCVCSIA